MSYLKGVFGDNSRREEGLGTGLGREVGREEILETGPEVG